MVVTIEIVFGWIYLGESGVGLAIYYVGARRHQNDIQHDNALPELRQLKTARRLSIVELQRELVIKSRHNATRDMLALTDWPIY